MVFSDIYRQIINQNFGDGKYCDDDTISKFEILSAELQNYNQKVNLTAVCDTEGIIVKHFADSLLFEKFIPKGAKLCDVGCGGGFPTLPLAIVRPDIKITALDSTEKKLKFVEYAANVLDLSNVSVLPSRAEETARKNEYRETFDCVCARAVARLNVLCELCLPLVSVGGIFISSKGSAADEEANEAKGAISLLSAKIQNSERTELISKKETAQRTIFIIKKLSHTDKKYPRPYGTITKKPLII